MVAGVKPWHSIWVNYFWFLVTGPGFYFCASCIVAWSLYRGYILLTKSALLDYIITVLLSIISVFVSFKLLLGSFDFDRLSILYSIAIPIAAAVLYVRQKRKQHKTITASLKTINTE